MWEPGGLAPSAGSSLPAGPRAVSARPGDTPRECGSHRHEGPLQLSARIADLVSVLHVKAARMSASAFQARTHRKFLGFSA